MFGSLRKRGGTIVLAAVVGAVAAGSPAVAAEVVAFAKSAGNANTVNKIGASKTPRAGMLAPAQREGASFPRRCIPASRQVDRPGRAGRAAGGTGMPGPAGAGANGATGSQGTAGRRSPRSAGPTGETRALRVVSIYPALVDVNPFRGRATDERLGTTSSSTRRRWNNAYRASSEGDPTSSVEWKAAARGRNVGPGGHARTSARCRHHDLLARWNRHRADRRVRAGDRP